MAFMSRRLNMAHGVFMIFVSILSVIYGLSNAAISGTQLPLVRIEDGQVQGAVEETLLDKREYYSFKGIPYGRSPVGSLRFKAPVKADAWTGVKNATAFGSPCAQPTMHLNNHYGEEDCLTLNVYTPDIQPNEPIPVLLYFHGGAFLMGTGRGMGPQILLNEDVILVTINYRLGPFGFLSLDIPEYSGNMGLKDQLLAMKWVQKNIHHFGGNPNSVTLYGHSAGAVSVHMHILSTASRGYFQRAIMSGASALVPWAYDYVNHTQIMKEMISKQTGTPTRNIKTQDLVEWLQTIDAKVFGMGNIREFFVGGQRKKSIDFTWMPVVESADSEQAFLTKSVAEYLMETNDIDTMFGFAPAECLLLTGIDLNAPETLKSFDEHFEVQLPLVDLSYNYTSKEYKSFAKEIRHFYFGNRSVDKDTLTEYVDLLSDAFFVYGVDRAVKAQAQQSSGRTYLFKFSGDLKLNFFRKFANGSELGISGATHTEDMCYTFRLSEMENLIDESEYDRLINNSPEARLAKTLTELIANFAQFGDPTPDKSPVEFRPIENGVINYVNITNDGLISDIDPHGGAIYFWDEFFRKYGPALHLNLVH